MKYLWYVLILSVALVTDSCIAQSSIAEDVKNAFPQESWSSIQPEKVGFSSKQLKAAKDAFELTGGIAMLVVVKGYVVADWGQTDQNIDSRSIRKSLINSLYGIYQEKGDINIESSLSDIQLDPKGVLSSDESKAKIKHLMMSASGIYLPAAFEESIHRKKPARGSFAPGTHFQYNNWDFNTLSTIFDQLTESNLFKAFDEMIAKPLQMEHFDALRNTAYISQPGLSPHPAYYFQISTKDLARYGLLYLREGKWNGNQLVPRNWVLESTRRQIETGEKFYYDFGYLWWVSKRESPSARTPFLARGAQSQYMYIDPANELIIVFRDNPEGNIPVSKSKAYPLIGSIYGAMTN